MPRITLLFAALCSLFLLACQEQSERQLRPPDYPETKTVSQRDTFFGTVVEDPYRWLENDTAPAVEDWVERQNRVTFDYLEQTGLREAFHTELEQLHDYTRVSKPFRRGEHYFFRKRVGTQAQAVLYWQKGLDGEAKKLLDPNSFSEDNTVYLKQVSVSHEGRYLAYSISRGGSDWQEIKLMDLQTGQHLSDHLEWVKFSGIAWLGQKGFFYSRYDKPAEGTALTKKNTGHKVYFHRVGTPQSQDRLVFEQPQHPERLASASVSDNERWVFLYLSKGSAEGRKVLFKPAGKPELDFRPLIDNFQHINRVVHTADGRFYLHTNHEAPNFRLVRVNPEAPAPGNWTALIPEQADKLDAVSAAGGVLFAKYLKDVAHVVKRHALDGSAQGKIQLPGLGTVSGFGGLAEDTHTFFTFQSYTQPPVIYRYAIEEDERELFRQPELPFDPAEYTTERVFYKSFDSTKVPLFLVHKKGVEPDGKRPTLLYGYGGFNISVNPSFKPVILPLLDRGGVYAVANIRGGSEYGERWHQAGKRFNKQNVFDDFIAAAEYLKEAGWTRREKLAIEGRSNGGLLVGATLTQRPKLCAVAFPGVGVLDMLRFHRFTIGHMWTAEYGQADHSEKEFDLLYGYSPYHNLRPGTAYPATLVTTGDHDDRVVPAHSFKFIARLQDVQAGRLPVLIRIRTQTGHGAGSNLKQTLKERADMYAFMFHVFGALPAQPS